MWIDSGGFRVYAEREDICAGLPWRYEFSWLKTGDRCSLPWFPNVQKSTTFPAKTERELGSSTFRSAPQSSLPGRLMCFQRCGVQQSWGVRKIMLCCRRQQGCACGILHSLPIVVFCTQNTTHRIYPHALHVGVRLGPIKASHCNLPLPFSNRNENDVFLFCTSTYQK